MRENQTRRSHALELNRDCCSRTFAKVDSNEIKTGLWASGLAFRRRPGAASDKTHVVLAADSKAPREKKGRTLAALHTISAGISQARSRLYPRRVGRVLRGPPERGIERGVHMPPFLWPPALDLTGMPSPRPGTGSANCSAHQRRKCDLVEPSPDPHVRGTRPSPVYKLFCPGSHLSSPLTLILTTITQPLLLGILPFPRVRLYRSPLPQRQRYTSPSRTLGNAP